MKTKATELMAYHTQLRGAPDSSAASPVAIMNWLAMTRLVTTLCRACTSRHSWRRRSGVVVNQVT
jgi:hypothetical protein